LDYSSSRGAGTGPYLIEMGMGFVIKLTTVPTIPIPNKKIETAMSMEMLAIP
jgi:hypothetical protein